MRFTRTAAALALLAGSASAMADGDVTFYLTLLHNNDGESQLINAGGDQSDFGGAARFATLVDQLRNEPPPEPVDAGSLLISSGDNFLAGPEFNASLTKGIPFFDTVAMQLIGYDVATVGNHEFDFGPDIFADFLAGFGGSLQFISANLDFTPEAVLVPFVNNDVLVERVVRNVEGRDIGVIGLTTDTLPFVSSPGDVIINSDLVGVVQQQVAALQAESVEIIILSSHLQSIQNEIDLVGQLEGLDVVIAGGGGELLANADDLLVPGDEAATDEFDNLLGYPVIAQDLGGTDVPIVTTSGNYKYVGRLIVGFNDSGEVCAIDEDSGPVRVSGVGKDAVAEDPDVLEQVTNPLIEALDELANNIIAQTQVPLNGLRSDIRTIETNLGNAIADAFLWQANQIAGDFGAPQSQVALANGGGIRNDSIIPVGDISELDTFDILPFTNFITVVENIDAQTFKELMENAVSAVEFESGRFAQVAGFEFVYDSDATPQLINEDGEITQVGERVIAITLNDGSQIVSNGQVVEGAPSVNVSTVNFLANGGDQYPFGDAPFTLLGVSYQQALFNYLVDELGGLVSALDYADGGEGRITDLAEGSTFCVADCDGSGSLDVLDFICFQQTFATGDLAADIDLDGNLTVLDFIAFQTTFDAGCGE